MYWIPAITNDMIATNPSIAKIQFMNVANTQATGPIVQIYRIEKVRNPNEYVDEVVSPLERPVPTGIHIPFSNTVPAWQVVPRDELEERIEVPRGVPVEEVLVDEGLPVDGALVVTLGAIPTQQIYPILQVSWEAAVPKHSPILRQLPAFPEAESIHPPPSGVTVIGALVVTDPEQHSNPNEHTPVEMILEGLHLPDMTQVPASPVRP